MFVANEDGKPTIRRYGESVANDIYVQEELNCYDPWAPDLPDDQPIRTIENVHRAAYYRSVPIFLALTSSKKRIQHNLWQEDFPPRSAQYERKMDLAMQH